MREIMISTMPVLSDLKLSAMFDAPAPVQAHRAPVPEPIEEPLPGEHPVPQEDPVPPHNPEAENVIH